MNATKEAEELDFSGKRSSYHSFERFDFTHKGKECIVVRPRVTAPGKPWIWKARFFGHAPQTEVALLEKGFHLVYVDVADLFGAPSAVAIWDDFHAYLTESHAFSEKPVLMGLSRGGLILYNWASKNPEKVACVYADAPVCDFKSWPRLHSSPKTWETCLNAYNMTEEEALKATCNPIDNLKPLVLANIKILHIVGDVDTTVPVSENTAILEERYKALGGEIQVIHKPDIGHHPHSLEDPTPIVTFILNNS
jgi:pimeloyl-ACP methyl ester carboxylesterase